MLLVIVRSAPGSYDLAQEGLGANGYGEHSPGGFPLGSVLLLEVVLTAILVFTVLAATDRIADVAFAGIPIGLVLTLVHLVGIPVDNTSVNPARSLAPALLVGDWALTQVWVFLVAPLGGGGGPRRAARLTAPSPDLHPERPKAAARRKLEGFTLMSRADPSSLPGRGWGAAAVPGCGLRPRRPAARSSRS